MSKQWVPPGMRECTWDEAERMNEEGSARMGITNGQRPTAGSWSRQRDITWLCIDTKPQHTHKPWVALGFERCTFAEAPKDNGGDVIGWDAGGEWAYGSGMGVDPIYLRPSPLLGLKRALDMFGEHHPDRWLLEAEIAKYEPPVCSECGRVK